jgi:hypothetical protein
MMTKVPPRGIGMRKAFVLSFLLATVVALLPKTALADDMFSGTWKSANCVYQLELLSNNGDNGLKRVANCPNYQVYEAWAAEFDGKDYPEIMVQNGRSFSGFSVSVKKTDDYIIEVTLNHNGLYNHRQKWTVSKDGKELRLTQDWDSGPLSGRHTVDVFTRQ